MSDDPTADFLASGGQSVVGSQDPTADFLNSGGQSAAIGNADPITQYLHSAVAVAGQNIGATGHVLYDWATGKVNSLADADIDAQQYKTSHPAYQPETEGGKTVAAIMGSPVNPLNWPSLAAKGIGKGVTGALDAAGVPSQYSTIAGPAVEAAGNVAGGAYGATKALGLGSTAAPEIAAQTTAVPADSAAKAGLLQRVGIDTARESTLAGDAKQAATDYQLSKLDEPAGVAAKTQFDAEKQALATHAQNIVNETGGTLGTDEDSLDARGQTIAAPFDALRQYFEKQKQSLYSAADQQAAGAPVGKMDGVQSLLKDPDFTETLLAKDQGGLLGSIQRQFSRFQDLSPDGFTVANAENFRKWLNQVWTPDNSATVGKVKGALDDDVLKGAGENIYGPARQIVQTEHQTLDNPNGVAKLMDTDPQNPLNRSTPYNKIPDTLTRLPPAQFDNVLKTLQAMPDELQPQAQAALGEIKAHLANKVLDAGSSTQGQWNSPAVTKVLNANSAKFKSAFEDSPQTLAKIQDLDQAGKILKVDQSYPGAAAQAANMLKRGLLSRSLNKLGGAVGAGAGGAVAGPLGAAAGGALGEAGGNALGANVAEKAALKNWESRTVSLADLLKSSGGSASQ